MTGQHRKPVPAVEDPPLVPLILAAMGTVVLGLGITLSVTSPSAAARPIPSPVAVMISPQDPTTTPAGRKYLAALAADGIGPDVLAPDQAVFIGGAVCEQHPHEGLPVLAQQARKAASKLTKMEAADLVDIAAANLCPS